MSIAPPAPRGRGRGRGRPSASSQQLTYSGQVVVGGSASRSLPAAAAAQQPEHECMGAGRASVSCVGAVPTVADNRHLNQATDASRDVLYSAGDHQHSWPSSHRNHDTSGQASRPKPSARHPHNSSNSYSAGSQSSKMTYCNKVLDTAVVPVATRTARKVRSPPPTTVGVSAQQINNKCMDFSRAGASNVSAVPARADRKHLEQDTPETSRSDLPKHGRSAARHVSTSECGAQSRPFGAKDINVPSQGLAGGNCRPGGALGAKPFAHPSRNKNCMPGNAVEPARVTAGRATVAAGTGQLYALHLRENCPSLPPVEEIVKRLQEIQVEFQKDGLSMERQCSMMDMERCWILDNLRTFNRILMRVDMELKEEEPHKLCICSLSESVVIYSNTNWVFDACILFHLLLKRHRCIKTLDLDKTAVASGYPQVLCDALACNRGLRHLAIACWDFSPEGERTLVYSLCKMPALESICISKLSMTPSAAGRIGDMVARSKCIRKVQFLENNMSPNAGKELMQGLCRNANLEVIQLDDNALGYDGARFLGEFLATSSKLQELSLREVPCFDEQQLIVVAEGLKMNRSLYKLEIHNCCVTRGGIDRLAEVLKDNSTLKCLTVTACNLGQPETKSFAILLEFNSGLAEVNLRENLIDDIAAIWLARALKFNRHLEKLNLEANQINSQGVVALVDALTSNSALKELTLGCVDPDDEEDYKDVTGALNRAVAYDRVRLCYDMRGVFQLSAALRVNANRITSVHLDSSVDLDATCLKDLFVALAVVPCLEVLCIESQTNMDGSAARRFAKVLTTTKTLRQVQMLACNADSVALTTVMRAMKKNQSVSHLDFEFTSNETPCIDAFLDVIKYNTTLHHFGYLSTKLSELQVIARELQGNHVLTSFKIWERPGFKETIFEINEILRRNVSYLNRAVEFAMDPEKFGIQRRPAMAYEELCRTDAFRKHLARVAGPHAVAEAMRNARRHITTNLFAITGVCKGPVMCQPQPGGARQIDCLNIFCWLNIFSHLKVTDIVM
ncbi:hypothetical protein V5799_013749 [Amblyomma americanum]|uniref:Ran gtpase-activating protein n=1 Tax=Amblyomma americanum TaxID=6943 RepID=A0AAQ4E4Y8_AMBAM